MITKHPLLSRIRENLSLTNFFNSGINCHSDDMLRYSLKLLDKARAKLLRWPTNLLTSNPVIVNCIRKMKLTHLLTPAGKRSVQYFLLTRRNPEITVGELTEGEYRSISWSNRYPSLNDAICYILRNRIDPVARYGCMLPTKPGILADLASISAKDIRLASKDMESQVICIYKIGLTLQPGEVINWSRNVKRLPSVRHKSTLLRLAHGEVYSNSRLHKFGMIDDPKCNNCSANVETILHKVLECPKAIDAWNRLNQFKET